jgi:hypothetical protein
MWRRFRYHHAMSRVGDPDRGIYLELAMRQLEGATVTVEMPTGSLVVNVRALADMVAELMRRLVNSGLDIGLEGRCDERLLNEGIAEDMTGKKCLGVTRTGHHAHMAWEASEDGYVLTLRARVRFVRVRRLIVEEEW